MCIICDNGVFIDEFCVDFISIVNVYAAMCLICFQLQYILKIKYQGDVSKTHMSS